MASSKKSRVAPKNTFFVDNEIVTQWQNAREIVNELDTFVVRSAKGSLCAGRTMRRGLRALKRQVHELVMYSHQVDSTRKDERKRIRQLEE